MTGRTTGSTTGRTTGSRRPALRGEPGDNTVELRGRVSSEPVQRELPSGVSITTFRMSIPRARTAMTAGSSQSVDWVDCAAWTARSRRTVSSWAVGDPVEVTGALRRRYFRSGDGSSTRLEIEVLTARRGRAADPGAEDEPGAT
ncbi:MAG: single-stranded DNA-binding protein [Nocardioidaceae bacterium]